MPFGEAKVYFDGSHYIAIPKTTRPGIKRLKPVEEEITIIQPEEESTPTVLDDVPSLIEENSCSQLSEKNDENIEKSENNAKNNEKNSKIIKKMTKKEFFNELYMKYINLSKKSRKEKIITEMMPYFDKEQHCIDFVTMNIERKQRNLICRRVRMCRKANLANFNYFCTFTYDSQKHTEEQFKKKLRTCFRHLCYRKDWKYMGVWERAPKTNRLHFHGLFSIPDISMLEFKKIKDYDTASHRMQESNQSEYFNKRFGRSDFKEIDANEKKLGNALAYLMKYIEKTGEKIVYSKGLPQYFLSDILDDDVVCTIGQEDKKLLLFDNFMCLDEGCYIGNVGPEVIEQMRKCN